MSNLTSTLGRLNSALQVLRQHWEQTKTLWNDSIRRKFEDDYWTPLDKRTQATQREMEKLAQVIGKARQSVK